MKFDLAFTLLDLDPWYKGAACEMIRSARRAYQGHDMRVVQLTDNRSARCPEADGAFNLDTDVKGNELALAKGHLMAEYALQADRPVIFCDVDLIWNNDLMAGVALNGVGCLWRDDMPAMPFNTGIVTTAPGQANFWERYRAACGNLPSEVTAWYGDQFAMLAAFPAPVQRLPIDTFAPTITELPSEPLKTPAVHFKGEAKHLMIPYARLVDRGAGFEFARPSLASAMTPVQIDFNPQGWNF